MKLKWYYVVCLICDLALLLIGILSGVIFFCYNLFDKGTVIIIMSMLLSFFILLVISLLNRWDKNSIKKALGPIMVESEGLLKIENDRCADAFVCFYKNGLRIYSYDSVTQFYMYKFISYNPNNFDNKYKIVMYIDSLGKCEFTCRNLLKIKAIKSLLKKYCV